MAGAPTLTLAQLQDRLLLLVQRSEGPACIHDLTRLAGRDPHQLGAAVVAIALLGKAGRGGLLSKPTIGAAGVRATNLASPDLSPCDYFYWPLATGVPATPDGLARFGPQWQAELLALKVRTHAETFPALYPGPRGPPRPDLTL